MSLVFISAALPLMLAVVWAIHRVLAGRLRVTAALHAGLSALSVLAGVLWALASATATAPRSRILPALTALIWLWGAWAWWRLRGAPRSGAATSSPNNRKEKTMGKTIPYDDYLRLVGLLTLAREHNRQIQDILGAALGITGEGRDDGFTADAVWDPDGARAGALLARLGIAVEPPAAGRAVFEARLAAGEEVTPDVA